MPIDRFEGEMLATDGGKRFLVRAVLEDPPPPPVTLIVNWRAAGK